MRRRFLVVITDNEPVDNLDINQALANAAADAFGEAVSATVEVKVSTYADSDFVPEPGTSRMALAPNANACADRPPITWFSWASASPSSATEPSA